jgi:hypothetical protein
MKHTNGIKNLLTQKNCPELFKELRNLAKDMGIVIQKKTTIPEIEMKIRRAMQNVYRQDVLF